MHYVTFTPSTHSSMVFPGVALSSFRKTFVDSSQMTATNTSSVASTQWRCLPLFFPYYQRYLLHGTDATQEVFTLVSLYNLAEIHPFTPSEPVYNIKPADSLGEAED